MYPVSHLVSALTEEKTQALLFLWSMASIFFLRSSLRKLVLHRLINQEIARKERRSQEVVENLRKSNQMNRQFWDNSKESSRMTMVKSEET